MSKLFIGNPHRLFETVSWDAPEALVFVLLQEGWRLKEAIAQLNGKRMEHRILTVNEAVPLVSNNKGNQRHPA